MQSQRQARDLNATGEQIEQIEIEHTKYTHWKPHGMVPGILEMLALGAP